MGAVLATALALTAVAFMALLSIRFGEVARAGSSPGTPSEPKRVDIKGTIRAIAEVPGLCALIFFATFNNFLGGIFMALLDAYGLSLVSVQTWGLLLGVLSSAVILSGLTIAKAGLGKQPLRALLLVNFISWSVACIFPIRASVVLLAMGVFVWMFLSPWAEAAEHTTLQKVVPRERQGRVFGFAQSVEQSASPITAFLIGPLAEFVVIPFMTVGWGAQTIGGWFGLAATTLAFRSSYYRQLSAAYAKAPEEAAATPG
jgi:DHA3 family multidrug efflux protein-like MFS transporter